MEIDLKAILIASKLVEYNYKFCHLDLQFIKNFHKQDVFWLASSSPSDFEYMFALKRVSEVIHSHEYSVYLELLFIYAQLKHWNKFHATLSTLKDLEATPDCVDGDVGHQMYYDVLDHYFMPDVDGGYYILNEDDEIVGHCDELGDHVFVDKILSSTVAQKESIFDGPPADVQYLSPIEDQYNVFERYILSCEKYKTIEVVQEEGYIEETSEKVDDKNLIELKTSCESPTIEENLIIVDENICRVDHNEDCSITGMYSHYIIEAIEKGFHYIQKASDEFFKCRPTVDILMSMSGLRSLRIDMIRRFYPV